MTLASSVVFPEGTVGFDDLGLISQIFWICMILASFGVFPGGIVVFDVLGLIFQCFEFE